MPIPSLLSIDPDKLFEQSSIQEIEEVQKKLQNEIDRKREELRTMVGERYRDLIEAADTISQMKILSEVIIDDVDKMRTATAQLQDQQVSGFRVDSHPNDVKNNARACAASQIKILIDVVEYIWDAMDSSEFTRATLLFLLARYVKTSLEINESYRTSQCFPLVSRQWSSMVHFKDTILNGAEKTLKTQHDSQVSCGGLLSLALLENLSTSQLLDRYLSLRSQALQAVLSTNQHLDSAAIKLRLCDSYVLLVNSFIVVFHCFLGTDDVQAKSGLLWRDLQSHVGPLSPPTIHLLDPTTTDIPAVLLPSAVREFRPSLNQPLEPVSESQVHETISSWLVWVHRYVQEQGGQLLQRLSSLRSLQGLREAPLVSEEWPLVAQKLQLPNADLWSDLYRSLITVRAQQLLSVHWDAALKTLQQHVQQAYEAAVLETKQTEVDLLWYMWKESTTDLRDINDLKTIKGQARGVTPRVAQLCAGIEGKVCSLLSDLATLCPEQEVDPALLTISHTLKAHQQTICSNLITRLVQFVKTLVGEATSESGAMLLAKFLQSVPELCPSLSRCLSSADSKSVSWQESHSLLQAECLSAYKVWLSLASTRVLKQITETLGTAVPDLHSIPQWEEINIEEEGEAGEKLQSVLKVPCSASLNLQGALHLLASVIGRVAIPKQISEQLANSVLNNVVELYSKNIDNNLTQVQYLQMLLDIKYLVHTFHTNSNKSLKNICQDAILKLEAKIDPFDLNVFTPYINNNVKISVQQTQALLGGSPVAGQTVTSQRSEEPSVLALSSVSSTWFPLLHITAPRTSAASNPPAKPKGKKSVTAAAPVSSTEVGTKPSSTTSFFGAMATDWFG